MYLSRFTTFAERVRSNCDAWGDRVAFTWLDSDGNILDQLTFAELERRARIIAGRISDRQAPGEAVILLCPPGLDYVASLVGALYAGALVLPAVLPTTARISERVRSIVADSRVRTALLPAAQASTLADRAGLSHLHCIDIAVDAEQSAPVLAPPARKPESPCILQYTSGSTSAPKGVVVTEANLLANQEMMAKACGIGPHDVCVSWLPPHHDMGLMGSLLQSIFVGSCTHLLSPDVFARRPEGWLIAASRHGATVLPGPDFAYRLCVSRIGDAVLSNLDLSAVRIAFTAAEPIRAGTLDAFVEKFASTGFQRSAFFPCYGMAEATLFISGAHVGSLPKVIAVDAEALRAGRVRPAPSEAAARRLVSSGEPAAKTLVRVAALDSGRVLVDGQVGELCIQSPSVAAGYFEKPEETAHAFGVTLDGEQGPFMRTGDMGFVLAGSVYLTGRRKEMLILNGLNHYPQDIEQTVQSVSPVLVAGAGVALVLSDETGEDKLVIVQEVERGASAEAERCLSAIVGAVSRQHGLVPASVVLVRRGSIPKTPSGKLQRLQCRNAMERGELRVVAQQDGRSSWKPNQPAPDSNAKPKATSSASSGATVSGLTAYLTELVATALGVSAQEIDPTRSLAEHGLDSLQAAQITEQLEDFLGRKLPHTLTYDNPSIRDLVQALTASKRSEPRARAARGSRTRSRVALVGMACRLPGADSPAALFENLTRGLNSIGAIPEDRWDVNSVFAPRPGIPGKMQCRVGGFLDGIDRFDAHFFHISPREATAMDPQQRLLLETTWHALEDAGLDPTSLAQTPTGVFAAASNHDYALLSSRAGGAVGADYGTGNSASVLANRISYFLDLHGPSQAIDTACSSGLVALHQAARAIEDGECDIAIVGAANAILSPEASISLSQSRALSPSGRCRPFDGAADGFVRSEGVAVLVLQRLEAAQEAGRPVRAIVAGSAVNHGGRSNGLMAPSTRAQEEVIRAALARAEVEASDVDVVETHGVGSPISDMVEWEALRRVMGAAPRSAPCWVGAMKGHIGHTEAVSGLASVIKVALSLEAERLPANRPQERPSSTLAAAQGALSLLAKETPWPCSGRPRRAGVSAFGFGGTNAHVILQEGPKPSHITASPSAPTPELFVLSAQHPRALAAMAGQLSGATASSSPASVSHSLLTGRAPLACRLAVVASTASELHVRLERAKSNQRTVRGEQEWTVVLRTLELDPAALVELAEALPNLSQAWLRRLRRGPAVPTNLEGDETFVRSAAGTLFQLAALEFLRAASPFRFRLQGTGAGAFAALAAAGGMSVDDAMLASGLWSATRAALTPGATGSASPQAFRKRVQAMSLSAANVSVAFGDVGIEPGQQVPEKALARHLLVEEPKETTDCEAGTHIDVANRLGHVAPSTGHPLASTLRGELLRVVADLFVAGEQLTTDALGHGNRPPSCALPPYPFQRQRYWCAAEGNPASPGIHRPAAGTAMATHPILSRARILTPPHHMRPAPATEENTSAPTPVRPA